MFAIVKHVLCLCAQTSSYNLNLIKVPEENFVCGRDDAAKGHGQLFVRCETEYNKEDGSKRTKAQKEASENKEIAEVHEEKFIFLLQRKS